jgi:hypothetical protein
MFSGHVPNKSAVFELLLNIPEIDVDSPPPSCIDEPMPFPDIILYDGDETQLSALVRHAKYKDEYMERILSYHVTSEVIHHNNMRT